jgi:hypothetical protein
MKSTGEWGQFFPGSFAPNPYDESWVSFYFPLSSEEQKNYGFYFLPQSEQHQLDHRSSSDISRASHETNPEPKKLIGIKKHKNHFKSSHKISILAESLVSQYHTCIICLVFKRISGGCLMRVFCEVLNVPNHE